MRSVQGHVGADGLEGGLELAAGGPRHLAGQREADLGVVQLLRRRALALQAGAGRAPAGTCTAAQPTRKKQAAKFAAPQAGRQSLESASPGVRAAHRAAWSCAAGGGGAAPTCAAVMVAVLMIWMQGERTRWRLPISWYICSTAPFRVVSRYSCRGRVGRGGVRLGGWVVGPPGTRATCHGRPRRRHSCGRLRQLGNPATSGLLPAMQRLAAEPRPPECRAPASSSPAPPRARLVRVVVARARLVAHPDAVVLHGGGVALKDLRAASRARGLWLAAGEHGKICPCVRWVRYGGWGAGGGGPSRTSQAAPGHCCDRGARGSPAVGCQLCCNAVSCVLAESGRRRCEY